jgi:stage II sporulation protein AB (anti-sigma F factor)
MKPINTMKLDFEGRSVNESFARTAVAAFIISLDPALDELSDVKTAVSEAVTNCIVHAYPDRIGRVYISASIYPGGLVSIKVKDKGCGILDIPRAMEPLFTTGDSDVRSGLGFSVMQSLMDKVRVRSKPGGPTTVTLERRIRSKGDTDA